MKHNNHKAAMVLDFFCAGVWALCAGFNLAAGRLVLTIVSLLLFTVFVAFGLFNRQKMK